LTIQLVKRCRSGERVPKTVQNSVLKDAAVKELVTSITKLLDASGRKVLKALFELRLTAQETAERYQGISPKTVDRLLCQVVSVLEHEFQFLQTIHSESVSGEGLEGVASPLSEDYRVALRRQVALERAIVMLPDAQSGKRLRPAFVLRWYWHSDGKVLAEKKLGQILKCPQATVHRWLVEAARQVARDWRIWASRDPILREDLESVSRQDEMDHVRRREIRWLAAMLGATTRLAWTRPQPCENRRRVALEHWWAYREFPGATTNPTPNLLGLETATRKKLAKEAEKDWRSILQAVLDEQTVSLDEASEAIRDWIALLRESIAPAPSDPALVEQLIEKGLQWPAQ
jgi:hypothetical protein